MAEDDLSDWCEMEKPCQTDFEVYDFKPVSHLEIYITSYLTHTQNITPIFPCTYDDQSNNYRFTLSKEDADKLLSTGARHYLDDTDSSLFMKIRVVPEVNAKPQKLLVSLPNDMTVTSPLQAAITELLSRELKTEISKCQKLDQYRNSLIVQVPTFKVAADAISRSPFMLDAVQLNVQLHPGFSHISLPGTTSVAVGGLQSHETQFKKPQPVKRKVVPGNTSSTTPKTEQHAHRTVAATLSERKGKSVIKKFFSSEKCSSGGALASEPEQVDSDGRSWLIHFEDEKVANLVASKRKLTLAPSTVVEVALYTGRDSNDGSSNKYTMVEASKWNSMLGTEEDIFSLLILFFEERGVDADCLPKCWTDCYNDITRSFWFNLPPKDIEGVLMKKPYILDESQPNSYISLRKIMRDTVVVVKAIGDCIFSEQQIMFQFEAKQKNVIVTLPSGQSASHIALLEFPACPKDAMVAVGRYTLHGSVDVFGRLITSVQDTKVVKENQHLQQPNTSAQFGLNHDFQNKNSKQTGENTLLVVENLMEIDQETLKYWLHCITNSWPTAIFFFKNKHAAVVRFDPTTYIDYKVWSSRISEAKLCADYRDYTVKLSASPQCLSLHVMADKKCCMTDLKNHFERTYGLPLNQFTLKELQSNTSAFTVEFKSVEALCKVIAIPLPSWGGCSFQVSYPQLGEVQRELNDFVTGFANKFIAAEKTLSSEHFSLVVSTKSQSLDKDNLKLLLESDYSGGSVDSVENIIPVSSSHSYRVIFKSSRVAQQIYEKHQKSGIAIDNVNLQIKPINVTKKKCSESENPQQIWLKDLDPSLSHMHDCLPYYFQCLSGVKVKQITYSSCRTKAEVEFEDVIDFLRLFHLSTKIPVYGNHYIWMEKALKHSQLLLKINEPPRQDFSLTAKLNLEKQFKTDQITITPAVSEPEPREWIIQCKSVQALDEMRLESGKISLGRYRDCTVSVCNGFLGPNVCLKQQQFCKNVPEIFSDDLLRAFLLDTSSQGYSQLVQFLKQHECELDVEKQKIYLLFSATQQNCRNWTRMSECLLEWCDQHLSSDSFDTRNSLVFEKVMAQNASALQQSTMLRFNANEGTNVVHLAGMKSSVKEIMMSLKNSRQKIQACIDREKNSETDNYPIKQSHRSYSEKIGFFQQLQNKHRDISIEVENDGTTVTIKGLPDDIKSARYDLFDQTNNIEHGRLQMSPTILNFFKQHKTMIETELNKQNLFTAYWEVDDYGIVICCGSSKALAARKECFRKLVCEFIYPEQGFDDPQKDLIRTPEWSEFNKKIRAEVPCMDIKETKEELYLVTLSAQRNVVQQKLDKFFDDRTRRSERFVDLSHQIKFIKMHCEKEVLHRVLANKCKLEEKLVRENELVIEGCKDDRALAIKQIKELVKSIDCYKYNVQEESLFEHYQSEDGRSKLDFIGFKTRTLIVAANGDKGYLLETKCADMSKLQGYDVLVNAANNELKHGGGLARALSHAAGPEFQNECDQYVQINGPLRTGQVMISKPYKLHCKIVIHVVGPIYKEEANADEQRSQLYSCVTECLKKADENHMKSIAIPLLSTGVYKYPLDDAIKIILEAISAFFVENSSSSVDKVLLVDNLHDKVAAVQHQINAVHVQKKTKPEKERLLFKSEIPTYETGAIPKSTHQLKLLTAPASRYKTLSADVLEIGGMVQVRLVIGALASSDSQFADVMVVSVDKDSNLSKGKVAPTLLKIGKQPLQDECTAKAGAGIPVGGFIEVDNHGLQCRMLFLANTPAYDQSGQCNEVLKTMMGKCLRATDAKGFQSIVFPVFGTGNLNFPPEIAAKLMLDAIDGFANSATSLKHVRIVIFNLDKHIQTAFFALIAQLADSSQMQMKRNSNFREKQHERQEKTIYDPEDRQFESVPGLDTQPTLAEVNKTILQVEHRDILAMQSDAIVNSTNNTMSMNGAVGSKILQMGGESLQREIEQLKKMPSSGVVCTKAGGLVHCKRIIHLSNHQDTTEKEWTDRIQKCLKVAEEHQLKSVAFPALGTGTLARRTENMSKIIMEAIVEYLRDHSNSKLEVVTVVVYEAAMIQQFVQALHSAVQSKPKSRIKKAKNFFLSKHVPQADQNTSFSLAGEKMSESNQGEMTLNIYSRSPADRILAVEALKDYKNTVMFEFKIRPTERRAKFVDYLTSSQVEKLEHSARSLNVKFSKTPGSLRLFGMKDDVLPLSGLVIDEVHEAEKRIENQETIAALESTIKWQYQFNRDWIDFEEDEVILALEKAFKKKQLLYECRDADGTDMTFDLQKNTMQCGDKSYPLRRTNCVTQFPDTWSQTSFYTQELLLPDSQEFLTLKGKFDATIGNSQYQIHEITRIQNPDGFAQYDNARKLLKNLPSDWTVERQLWHGSSKESIDKIVAPDGFFNRSFAGDANAVAFGIGNYFAVNASYSADARYAKPDAAGFKYLILAYVITGEYCKGERNQKEPPKNLRTKRKYNSRVNDMTNPTIFVSIGDWQAYPAYVVKFK